MLAEATSFYSMKTNFKKRNKKNKHSATSSGILLKRPQQCDRKFLSTITWHNLAPVTLMLDTTYFKTSNKAKCTLLYTNCAVIRTIFSFVRIHQKET